MMLLLPALLVNLGINPFFAVNDEAIRILVALEMHLSGDYLTPTTMGEFYLRKPPLYNWLIIISSLVNGEFSEFSSRIVTVISLLFFGFLVYHFSAKHMLRYRAALLALAVVTTGRILFFDSFLGLIDIAHGAVIYWAFMLVYHYYHKQHFWRLFLLSYLLIAVAYLMKGLPALVFQGITLMVFFTYKRQFRKLFSLQHFAGIGLFLLIVGGYYLAYLGKNELSFSELFAVLFDQSAQRTSLELGIGRTIGHIFAFPFEFLYHFAPWTIMVVLLFRKGVMKQLFADPWLKYNSLIFFFNILIYWVSPGVFARYFFMMLPLLFSVFFHYYFEEKEKSPLSWRIKVVEYAFLFFAGLALLGLPVIPFTEIAQWASHPWVVIGMSFVMLLFAFILMIKRSDLRIPGLILSLLIIRVVFNFFVLPDRASAELKYKIGAQGVVEAAGDEVLYIYPHNGLIQESDAFYISNGRQEILRTKYADIKAGELYLLGDKQWDEVDLDFEEIYRYECKWYDRPISLVRMKERTE